jgi:hypothetical protein
MRRHDQRCTIHSFEGDAAWQVAIALAFEVGCREDEPHPRHGPGRLDIEPLDDPVRMVGAEEACHEHALGRHVVGVAPLAAQQPRVLAARHALPIPNFGTPAIGGSPC